MREYFLISLFSYSFMTMKEFTYPVQRILCDCRGHMGLKSHRTSEEDTEVPRVDDQIQLLFIISHK